MAVLTMASVYRQRERPAAFPVSSVKRSSPLQSLARLSRASVQRLPHEPRQALVRRVLAPTAPPYGCRHGAESRGARGGSPALGTVVRGGGTGHRLDALVRCRSVQR
jgi:hypothetical protein